MKRLVIFGVSNLLSDLFDCALALGHTDFLVVPNAEEVVRPRTRPFRERIADLPPGVRAAVVPLEGFAAAEGDVHFVGTTAAARFRLVRDLRARFGIRLVVLIHPSAYVSPLAAVAEGVFVGAGSVIGPAAVLHECAFINRSASVGHDTVIGPYARVQPGANLGGHIRIGAFVTVGIGAAVVEETVVGDGALIAGGAVVTADVEPNCMVAGIPAVAKKLLEDKLPSWRELDPHLAPPAVGRA